MGKIRSALYKFLYGRYCTYGSDTLNNVLLYTYLGLFLVHTVVFAFVAEPAVVYWIYLSLTTAIVFYMLFRMFSKNIAKRRRENEKFTGFFKLRRNKWRDRKTHVYKKCPSCKAVLRLPKAKGQHNVVCPRCKNRFQVGW